MNQPIVVTVPHNLGAEAAKSRVSRGIERLKADYLDKLARTEIHWTGNRADLQVSALGQTVNAKLDVQNDLLRIEVQFRGFLSGLFNKVSDKLISNVKGSLQLEHTPRKS
ncbi:MAG: polyhydroxyalkanoic acid system family protein [Methylocystis sp.]